MSEVRTSIERNLIKDGWTYVGQGRMRKVYRRGDVVVKVPIYNDPYFVSQCVCANKKEYRLYKNERRFRAKSNRKYAPCRLLHDGSLMMWAVTDEYDNDDKLPSWCEELVDGPQVGYHKSGKLYIYDYADE